MARRGVPRFRNYYEGVDTAGQASEQHLRLLRKHQELVESLDAIVWEADPATLEFTYVSPRAEAILGYPVSEWLAQPSFWIDHIHPDDRDRAAAECKHATAAGHDHKLEYRMIHADGAVVDIADVVRVLRDEHGNAEVLRGILFDVTDRKQASALLAERESQLVAAQKMEALGRLAGEVAHDFNNLLVVVTMSGGLLQKTLAPGSKERVHVDEIVRAAERGSALTRQLLTFARGGAAVVETIDVAHALADVERMVRLLVGPEITLRVYVDPDTAFIEFDRGKLEQVFVNLATNAREAMLGGGTLSFTARNAQLLPAEAAALSLEPGDYVQVSVTDTGTGMTPDIAERVFEPFFTTRQDTGGHGLGLSSVYGIVRHHGGHVAVKSSPGAGTTFDVYVRAVAAE
jgi:two-component system, cell cycle sensor histidine kinase and response regulator CckA